MTAYDFSFQSIDGEALSLSDFRGKAVLVVNTASRCGYTPQYQGLQSLYEEFGPRGLVVLGVPSNDFAGQEPGTEAEIKKFCDSVYRITFPMTEKVSVKGAEAHPFYQWAAEQERGGKPGWNFHKYLIAPDGTLAASYGSSVKPESGEIKKAVEAVLP